MTRSLILLVLLPLQQCLSCPAEVAFSPDCGAMELVVRIITEAKRSVRFTSRPIAEALLAAHRHGIDVEVTVDKSNAMGRGKKYQPEQVVNLLQGSLTSGNREQIFGT